jgi:hypothetical protein
MKLVHLALAAMAALLAAAQTTPAGAAAPEREGELAALEARVDGQVRAFDFAALDAEADALRASRARLADGRWKLSMMFGAVDEAMAHVVVDEADRRALESMAAAYARAHPASANAGLFLAHVALAEGWMARGQGEWKDVPADGQRRFQAALAQAREILDANRKVLSANPVWYADRIEIASLGGEPAARVDELLRAALAREPRFHAAAYAALAARSPRRGGSAAAMMAFANDVGRATEAARAEGLYARLVIVAQEDVPRIERDPALDWAAMTRAFDAILASYPAPRNVRRFLLMACDRPDRAVARVLLRYADAVSPPLHGSDVERCIAWARETPAASAASASASAPARAASP